ncbi:uncharacterized protein TNCV_1437631 [Trichonephila clavipes]|nr:uncharacterized protein TNCV_1437631 [Trichonephila clavipes]
MFQILLWSPWKYRCGQRTVRMAVVACSQKQNSLRAQAQLMRTETVETVELVKIVRVQYFVRGGFVGHHSRASSKHLSSHLPVDGVRFLGGQKGVALQLQDARVGVGSNKDAERSRCSEK